jgi:signal transduction histidine kinase
MMEKGAATHSTSTGNDSLLSLPGAPFLRCASWARVLLATAALGLSLLYPPPSPAVYRIVVGVFLSYALLVAARIRGISGVLSLLALFGDLIFFLILASMSASEVLWLTSVFFLFLLVEALLFYTPLEVLVITGVCALFCAVLPGGHIRVLEPTILVSGVLSCGMSIGQQRLKREVENLERKLDAAEKAAKKARDEERQRIASDFHDGPLQSFISLQMRLEILRTIILRDFDAGMEDLKQLQSLAQAQVRDLRTFLHNMRPVDVDGANFIATARRTAESFQKESGIPVTFVGSAGPVGLPQEMSLEVLQILRESLHNVQKHAGATRVAVAIEKTDRCLEISIDDNGHGFPFAGTYSLEELELLRLGPASLKRRARSLNADLLLESRPGRGAGLKFRIPLS